MWSYIIMIQDILLLFFCILHLIWRVNDDNFLILHIFDFIIKINLKTIERMNDFSKLTIKNRLL